MKYFLIILVLFLAYIAYFSYKIKKAYSLAEITYTQNSKLGKKSNKRLKLLILGDSLGTGVGASSFKTSVVGRVANSISKKYFVILTNASLNGSKIGDLLKRKVPKEKQDLIVIFISTNNVLRFTDLKDFGANAIKVIEKYSKLTKKLILIGPANVGQAKILPLPLRLINLYRAPKYATILSKVSKKFKNVAYINSLKPPKFLGKYKYKYYSSDKLHPNDEGHSYWFEMVKGYL